MTAAAPGGTAEPTSADVVVVGAGVAGLVVAHDVARAGLSVALLEAGERVGGMLRRADLGGVAVDVGAESFATRTSGVADLIADAGLPLRTVAPERGGAHLAAVGDDGILHAPLPRRTVLGIPADPLAEDVLRILGGAAARRVAAEPSLDRDASAAAPEPSLADLVAERCGPELVRRLVDPLCRSVYSVAASDARLSRLHPALWREYVARGSLIEAAAVVAAPERAGSAVAGIDGGMWRLAEELDRAARAAGVRVRTGVRVDGLTAAGRAVDVAAGSEVLRARRVVVATGAIAARALLAPPASAGSATPPASAGGAPPVRVVAALVAAPELDIRPVGSGVIVAADVDAQAKALTHVTAKWGWAAAAAPAGHHIVRLSARAATSRLDTPEDLAREITLLTGVAVAPSAIVARAEAVWTDAVAAAPVDPARRAALAADGIHLAGAPVAGTGLASVVPHARELARDLVRELTDAGSDASDSSTPVAAARTAAADTETRRTA